jgi:predicted PurR-regulated permease PerM
MSAPPSFLRLEPLLLVLLLGLLAFGTLLVLLPFVSVLLWASILCYATWPLFDQLTRLLKGRRSLAAFLMCVAVTLLLVLPFVVVGASLGDSVAQLAQTLQQALNHAPRSAPSWLASLPLVGNGIAEYWQRVVDDPNSLVQQARAALPTVSRWLLAQGLALAHGVLMLVLAVFVAFFIYRDGASLADHLAAAVERLGGERGVRLMHLAGGTIQGVVYGILGTALAQGILAGIGFLITGVPGALMLGLLTFFLSIIPMGPPLVWIPAAIWLFAQGETGMAIFLALWGALVVSSIDNVLKPYLISKGADLPFILVLFAVLGGILAFGFLGVFLGPTLIAVSFSLLKEWTLRPSALKP